jgi:hypothetical protein
LAIRQLIVAMSKRPIEFLPTKDATQATLRDVEQFLEHYGHAVADSDLGLAASLPDLRVKDVAQYPRENYHSGVEYLVQQTVERSIDLSSLRSLASRLRSQHQDH